MSGMVHWYINGFKIYFMINNIETVYESETVSLCRNYDVQHI